MEIQGTVSAVVFANEETGYRVLRLDNNLTAVGVAPMVSVGAEYKFVGEFVNNAKHGKQFAFTELVLLPPDNEEKILAFLGGGLLPGVGPATAKKIVKKFGMQTLEIIEKHPEELTQIRGISPTRAQSIGVAAVGRVVATHAHHGARGQGRTQNADLCAALHVFPNCRSCLCYLFHVCIFSAVIRLNFGFI